MLSANDVNLLIGTFFSLVFLALFIYGYMVIDEFVMKKHGWVWVPLQFIAGMGVVISLTLTLAYAGLT